MTALVKTASVVTDEDVASDVVTEGVSLHFTDKVVCEPFNEVYGDLSSEQLTVKIAKQKTRTKSTDDKRYLFINLFYFSLRFR